MTLVKHLRFVVFLLSGILMSSCTGKFQAPETRYYLPEYDPPRMEEPREILKARLEVERFQVAALYDRFPIVVREGAYRWDHYVYQLWRVHPGDLLSDFLIRDLRSAELFDGVVRPESSLRADFRVEGELEEFIEWNDPEGRWGVLSATITLLDLGAVDATRRLVFQRSYHVKERVEGEGPKAVVKAMSGAMQTFSGRLIRDVYGEIHARMHPENP